jgi:hypothetical protein
MKEALRRGYGKMFGGDRKEVGPYGGLKGSGADYEENRGKEKFKFGKESTGSEKKPSRISCSK